MRINPLFLLTLVLGLSACASEEKSAEDSIQAIQNAQLMRDALNAKGKRPHDDGDPLPELARQQVFPLKRTSAEFVVDKKTGKIDFKAEIVYFGFDDATLTEDGRHHLNALANYMKKHKSTRLSIDGHCDSRGSVEYNLALGLKRSDSVRTYLTTRGIAEDRLDARTFGKEKPAVAGDNEDALAKNRRVEFTFSNLTDG